jgi:quinol monooxygenase YgiN
MNRAGGGSVLVTYVTFEVDPRTEAEFDDWFAGLVRAIRATAGCVVYDFLANPGQPGGRAMVEVWESEADREAHLVQPAHVEMVARASSEFGMRNLRAHYWEEAMGHHVVERKRSDMPVEGRDDLNRLVFDYGRDQLGKA